MCFGEERPFICQNYIKNGSVPFLFAMNIIATG